MLIIVQRTPQNIHVIGVLFDLNKLNLLLIMVSLLWSLASIVNVKVWSVLWIDLVVI